MTYSDPAVIAAIIAAISGVSSAVIVAVFSARSASRSREMKEISEQLFEREASLCNAYLQIAAYHRLEALACAEISKATGRNSETLKKELRNQVVMEGLTRPSMTGLDATARYEAINSRR